MADQAGPDFASAQRALLAIHGKVYGTDGMDAADKAQLVLAAAEKLVGEQRQDIARLRETLLMIREQQVEDFNRAEAAESELSRLTGPREPSLPVPDMVWPEWLEWQADLMEAWKPGPDPIGPLHGAGMATAYTGLAKHYRSEAVRIRKRRASREPSPAPNQEKS